MQAVAHTAVQDFRAQVGLGPAESAPGVFLGHLRQFLGWHGSTARPAVQQVWINGIR
ncbi:MAG: hypothetical protein ACYDFT_00225 [Thermoplasmata archaeon]